MLVGGRYAVVGFDFVECRRLKSVVYTVTLRLEKACKEVSWPHLPSVPSLKMAPQKSTIKQAKAAFKARGRPAISDMEKRTLERAAELEKRAKRAREQDKRRSDAVKKRQEREAKQRRPVLLATQRKCDRFGHKSSQFHLGAFMKIGSKKEDESTAEDFEDDDVDDESLLDALGSPPRALNTVEDGALLDQILMPPPPRPRPMFRPIVQPGHRDSTPKVDELDVYEMDVIDGFLDSSSQIARELGSELVWDARSEGESENLRLSTSFGSSDFDLSAEDLEELESVYEPAMKPETTPKSKVDKQSEDRQRMPPPPLPPAPANRRNSTPQRSGRIWRPVPSMEIDVRAPAVACFTLTELESFVDDDLQLTQAPG